jgi:hypothetical protein
MPVSQNLKLTMPEKKEFDALPANLYQVQIEDITQTMKRPYKAPQDAEATEEYLTFEFVVLNEGEYRGRKLWKDVRPVPPTPSEGGGFKPSWMWRIVSAVYAKPFTFQEGVNFGPDDVNSLIGRQLRLMVNQNPKGEKVYNNITDVLGIEKELEPVLADNVPSEIKDETTGYEKAKAVAASLPGAKIKAESLHNDPTNEEHNPMVNDDELPPF